MPSKPRSPCPAPRCPNLKPCPVHGRQAEQAYDRRRGSADSRGYDARHRRWRELVLAEHPICSDCAIEDTGRVVAAVVADHFVALALGGDWSLENGRGLCRPCHARKSTREGMLMRGLAVSCSIAGCEKPARSGVNPYCEMHYARVRRHGDPLVNLGPAGAGWVHTNGYRMLPRRNHPLADSEGRVYEHRLVLYEKIGPGAHACHWCRRAVSWDVSYLDSVEGLVADHLDNDRLNNDPANLVPACNPCNGKRDLVRVGRGDRRCEGCGALTDRRFCSPSCSGSAGGKLGGGGRGVRSSGLAP